MKNMIIVDNDKHYLYVCIIIVNIVYIYVKILLNKKILSFLVTHTKLF